MSALILESMIRFLYNDMPPAEHAEFMMTIENNQAMMEQFQLLLEGVEALGELSYSPSEETILAISNYASQSSHN